MTIHSDTPLGDTSQIPKAALWLGLSGLLPFFAGAGLLILDGADILSTTQSQRFLTGYGAVILSFLGGVRWGLALANPNGGAQAKAQSLSVLPSLIGWVALLLPFSYGLGLLAIAFLLQGLWDIRSMKADDGQQWYGKLRVLLTTVVTTFLAVLWIFETVFEQVL